MWNHHLTLGISRSATRSEIVRAYRRLAMKWHPDRNPGNEPAAEREFNRIRKAYEALSDARRNGAHEPGSEKSARQQPAGQAPQPELRPTGVPGADLKRVLCVPLEVALGGGEVVASFFVTEPCGVCKGACTLKSGHPCGVCRGTGLSAYHRRIIVPVKAGAWDGQNLVLTGEGCLSWNGGPRGNAVFTVRIACPTNWFRVGLHLMGDLPIDYTTAALGGTREVEVLGHRLGVDIPPNCPPGKWLMLQGKALGDSSGQRGRLYLRVIFTLPQNGREPIVDIKPDGDLVAITGFGPDIAEEVAESRGVQI
jgi:molecular chaperone DnaJ